MLTDRECRNARAQERQYKLRDGAGLYLDVRPTGYKAWRYRYERTVEGRKRENSLILGDYASPPRAETEQQAQERRAARHLTLREAREECQRLRDLRRRGIDPAEERKRQKEQREQERAHTVEQLCREWVEFQDWQPRTRQRRLSMLIRVAFPALGSLPAVDVQSKQIRDMLFAAREKNGATVAEEARRTLSAVFDHAVANLVVTTNPVTPLRRALPPHRTQNRTALKPEEVGTFLRGLAGYDHNFLTFAATRLMWLTLARTCEVVGARWDEIDLDQGVWRLPAERMKAARPHIVPLPKQARKLLETVHGVTGTSEYVFPNRSNTGSHMTTATIRGATRAVGWAGRYTPHATRVTGSTLLSEMGYPSDWIERQLAHQDPSSVKRAYNHAEHLQQRAEMMQAWADHLDRWQAGQATELHGQQLQPSPSSAS